MRIASLIAAFYYFVITMGVSISLHFCKGELTCFSFSSDNEMCCHVDNEDFTSDKHTVCSENCCSTESLNIALDTDFTLESVNVPNSEFPLPGEGIYIEINVDTQTLTQNAPTRGSPASPPLYLLHSSFIFYG